MAAPTRVVLTTCSSIASDEREHTVMDGGDSRDDATYHDNLSHDHEGKTKTEYREEHKTSKIVTGRTDTLKM